MATIQDIANEVGISKAAVSRILNRKGSFSEETIARVLEAARRLNYVLPNSSAASQEDDLKLILAVSPKHSTPYFGILLMHLQTEAEKYGYNIVLSASTFNRETIEKNLRQLAQRKVSGIIVATYTDYADLFVDASLPVVVVGSKMVDGLSTVHSDDVAVGRIAARHLMSRGAKEFVYVSGNAYGLENDGRYQGFASELERCGHTVVAQHLTWGDIDAGTMSDAVMQVVLEHPTADGIFAESQTLSMECLNAYQSLGYRIPQDVHIIGYGNPYLSGHCLPKLTVIRENTQLIAQKAIEQVVRMIEGETSSDDKAPEIVVPVALEVNQTT